MDLDLAARRTLNQARWTEGFRESRRCSRDTYPESYITEYTLVYEDKTARWTLKQTLEPMSD